MKGIRKSRFFILLVDNFIKKGLMRILSDRQFMFLEFLAVRHKILRLKNPLTFTQKIQWLKLYGGLEKLTNYVDKLKVRPYVASVLGKDYSVPLLGVWDRFEDIDFNKLPSRFVLKATHGSAYVYVCKDKSLINKKELKIIVDQWMHENFYLKTRERQYKYCQPKIICEEYLEDENGELIDYKIFCTRGEPKIIEVVWGRYTNDKGDIYKDLNWNTLNISYVGFPISKREIPPPNNLPEVLELAKKLAQDFPFVRVDMYALNNKIYFGELTFTPANGLERFMPEEAEYTLGELIDLTKY